MTASEHIPLELLQTFVRVVELGGDASAAAQSLEISQPSISKRMSALRRIVGDGGGRPWLILKGKRWLLTEEGERVCGVVTDLVRRYEQVDSFIADKQTVKQTVSIACGQMAACGFVANAITKAMIANPNVCVRVSTPRGRSRIEGVAGGQFDFAIVTDTEATIREAAGIELYIESLQLDRFAVAANPSAKAAWAKAWNGLPVRRPLKASDLVDLPLILPEADAGRRQQFDQWYSNAIGRTPNVVLEVGGWRTILQFITAGLGVGLVTEQAIATENVGKSKIKLSSSAMVHRYLDEQDFPPDSIRLIARQRQGQRVPDLTPIAKQLYTHLQQAISELDASAR